MILAATLILCLLCASQIEAGKNNLRNFDELLAVVRRLESSEALIRGDSGSEALKEQRLNHLGEFAREPKVAHCSKHYEDLDKVIADYRKKAYEYVDDSRKSKNWLSSLASKIGGPLNSMKGLSKFSPDLVAVTERYEQQARSGLLQHVDVDCDLEKFKIKNLDAILVVLQADLKYLLTGDLALLNKSIYERLKQDKFTAANNFYEVGELTPPQKELIYQYYVQHADPNQELGAALDHFQAPSSYVVGRVLENCHALPEYVGLWQAAELRRAESCSASVSDPGNASFASQHSLDKYMNLREFCTQLFRSL